MKTPLLLLTLSLAWPLGVWAQEPAAAGEDAPAAEASSDPTATACLECHSDPEMEITLKSGETLNLAVDPKALSRSVHAGEISCTDCHVDMEGGEEGHEKKRFPSRRDFAINLSKQCAKCHREAAASAKKGVHSALLEKGNKDVAVCSDCHGAHDTQALDQPVQASRACDTCHKDVFTAYSQSVHGKGMLAGNADVPSCADCHGTAHEITNPNDAAWRLEIPQLCGKCHADEKVVGKYGLSTNVLETYLADFHGTTASLQREQTGGATPVVALCTDCHGIHDIARTDDPNSRVIKQNLLETCRKCHPDANENFPAAWLGHYEPSLDKAPLVFGVKIFYYLVVPFMIGGLLLQVLMHLWRTLVKR